MKRTFISGVILPLLVLLTHSSPVSAEQFASASGEVPVHAAIRKSGSLRKADTSLATAFTQYREHVAKGRGLAFAPASKFLRVSGDSILVDARATDDGNALLADLVQLGLTNASHYGDVVSGLLPFSAIDDAIELESLRSISASPPAVRHTGSITSQGDVALRAHIARPAFAVDGTGVTVGVISDSFDTLLGAAADIASGDLPSGGVPVLNGESILCGTVIFCVDEGRAMMQIIHDVAPGADLLFQSGIDGIAAYASAISNLAANGADIIVDDLLIINEPMFQDGIVAQAVDSVTASGTAYFTAAGNSGRQSYESAFNDSGEIFCIEFFEPYDDCDPMFERVGSMHDFDPGSGVDNYLNITVPVNSVMTIAMQWDQPYGGAGPTTDHDIVLLDGLGETYITISANDNIIMGEGWEALQFDNNEVLDYGSEFSVMITYDDVDSIGAPATLVKLVIFGQDVTVNEWATNSGALFGHPNAASATAVGAAFYMDTPMNGTSPPVLRPSSSAGGTPIIFDVDGTRLAEPVIRQAPEIVAVDGVNTTFFFDDSIGNDGIDDFTGTSAAAPHAAGVAALVLEAKPSALPDQLNRVLQKTATDMGVQGVDFDSGYGLIQADAAIAAVLESLPNDHNGDGNADILWRHAVSGRNVVHLLDGSTIISNAAINRISDLEWKVVGSGDYNGDANADILWRHGLSGRNVMHLMDGATVLSNTWVSTIIDQQWKVAGNGDYNGDGKADILWRHGLTGRVVVHLMDGATILANEWVSTVSDLQWQIVGSGDYNGDGNADILWRHAVSGRNVVHLLDGSTIISNTAINSISDLQWKIVGSGDYDGDGKADILWRHGLSGRNVMHLMDGATVLSNTWVSTISDQQWKVAGNGDYNGDGKADILWRHGLTGRVVVHLMDGATILANEWVSTVSDLQWQVINTN